MKRNAVCMAAIALLPWFALADRPINELPMYGGKHNPTVEQNPAHSRGAAESGWKAYYQGDFDTAIKRFNQAWMFNRDSSEVYWGFGLIMGQRASAEDTEKNLEESVRFLQIAADKDPENGKILGDLAYSHTLLGLFHDREGRDSKPHFDKAGELFPRAFLLDPEYPPILASWSTYCFYTGDFRTAKEKADQAMKLGYEFSPEYLMELEERLAGE